MAGFADELRAGIDEAAREMAGARLAGDDYGAGAWRERLSYLRRVARRHGIDVPAAPGGETGGRPAVGLAPPPDGGAQADSPPGQAPGRRRCG